MLQIKLTAEVRAINAIGLAASGKSISGIDFVVVSVCWRIVWSSSESAGGAVGLATARVLEDVASARIFNPTGRRGNLSPTRPRATFCKEKIEEFSKKLNLLSKDSTFKAGELIALKVVDGRWGIFQLKIRYDRAQIKQ
jgi:hypothetical protein